MVGITVFEACPFLPLLYSPPHGQSQEAQVLVASDGDHMVIATNIPTNRMARWLEGSIGEYAGGGTITASLHFQYPFTFLWKYMSGDTKIQKSW
jgi:hypothetical protein